MANEERRTFGRVVVDITKGRVVVKTSGGRSEILEPKFPKVKPDSDLETQALTAFLPLVPGGIRAFPDGMSPDPSWQVELSRNAAMTPEVAVNFLRGRRYSAERVAEKVIALARSRGVEMSENELGVSTRGLTREIKKVYASTTQSTPRRKR